MQDEPVIIAGGGIGGLTLALTLQQIGVPCRVLESAAEMKPLGVGINIQPNAVRELYDLGIGAGKLDTVGVQAREWALVGLNGKEVYAEARGLLAGYNWPQYAVHRGELHMLLYHELLARGGEVQLGTKVTGYETRADGARVTIRTRDGQDAVLTTPMLIGADGIHSAVRARMHPDQPPIHWGGAVMWRGTVRAKPLRTGSSFVGLGTHQHRMVIYPISAPDADGYALINWIAEVTMDSAEGWQQDGWFKPVAIDEFIHHFQGFRYDWLDVPAMLQQADCAYVNPMIDRDPVATWVDGPVALMGDAAHTMYPTGSNGASQAIVDARVLGAKILEHGVTPLALAAYNDQLCGPISELVLRNRGAGPFGLLNLLDERCGGVFDDINAVIPEAERNAFMAKYKAAAGFAIEALNAAPPTIGTGATRTAEDAPTDGSPAMVAE
jgi:2-polyprenyl-6-methoxyphenol hydroxylase-like FAD-dependent oxidoreductase